MGFQPGDHLRVHRRRRGVPYTHHAINFPDGRVVEFGGSTANKPAMGVDFGRFECFASGDRVDVVRHDDHDAALAMRRAEWLVSCPPTRRYNGIGFNCEHVARWCATGWETESLQIRHRVFGGKSVFVGLLLMLRVAWALRIESTAADLDVAGSLRQRRGDGRDPVPLPQRDSALRKTHPGELPKRAAWTAAKVMSADHGERVQRVRSRTRTLPLAAAAGKIFELVEGVPLHVLPAAGGR